MSRAAVALLLASACTQTEVSVLPAPIPLVLAGGALTAPALVGADGPQFTALVDTGTALTTYDDQSGQLAVRTSRLRLLGGGVPRLELRNIRLYLAPLRRIGVDPGAAALGAVLGGDQLEQFSIGLSYAGQSPTMTLKTGDTRCSCEIADTCQASFPFSLQGGQELLRIGNNVYSFPATRVVLDACLEPLPDPVSRDVRCVESGTSSDPSVRRAAPYEPSGLEVRLLVATGFPGFALSSSAYDRLRGRGAAQALFGSGATLKLHLPGPADDGPDRAGLTVGVTTVGSASNSALALVSREVYFGPCAELARSRRQRRSPPGFPRVGENSCLITDKTEPCTSLASDKDACSDASDASPAAAIVELQTPVPTWVLEDVAPLIQGINADVRPSGASVDGIIGTEILGRLESTIDYPDRRLVARCAGSGCLTYPRFVARSHANDCTHTELCRRLPTDSSGGLCR